MNKINAIVRGVLLDLVLLQVSGLLLVVIVMAINLLMSPGNRIQNPWMNYPAYCLALIIGLSICALLMPMVCDVILPLCETMIAKAIKERKKDPGPQPQTP